MSITTAPLATTANYPAVFLNLIGNEIGKEGAYSNDPGDAGGETMWGITKNTAVAFGYTGDMKSMSRDIAVLIYWQRYWIQPGFDLVSAIDMPIATKLLGIGINAGPATGVEFLQKALNVNSNQGTLYPKIGEDGGCGALTRQALKNFIDKRGADGRKVLLFMIIAQQGAFYIADAKARPTDEAFEWGWQLNRAMASTIPGV